VGLICRHKFPSPVRSLSLSISRARIAIRRAVAPRTPFFSLCAVGLTCQFCPLRARRRPARAHSRTSPDFSATMPAHAPSSLLRAPQVPRAHPSPHFTQLHPLSRSSHAAGDPRPRSRPSSSPETTPSLPELRSETTSCPRFLSVLLETSLSSNLMKASVL
jgi:hypothetical protein